VRWADLWRRHSHSATPRGGALSRSQLDWPMPWRIGFVSSWLLCGLLLCGLLLCGLLLCGFSSSS